MKQKHLFSKGAFWRKCLAYVKHMLSMCWSGSQPQAIVSVSGRLTDTSQTRARVAHEAIEAHRRVSGGQSRSKCAAQVRKANIELLKAEWLKYAAMFVMLFTIGSGNAWGDQVSSTFTDRYGAVGTGEPAWTVTGSTGFESASPYRGIAWNKVAGTLTNTSLSSYTITKIVVVASANAAVSSGLSITVGGNAFGGAAQTISKTNNTSYTFNGSASGTIVISTTAGSKSVWIKSVTVTYTTGGGTIDVTGVTLNKNNTSIVEGYTETLTATVAPSNATDKGVTWASSDETIATVASGVVTAVAPGSATITVTTDDGGYTATCAVTVTSICGSYSKATYTVTSASAVSASGAPTSAGATFSNTYTNNKEQITASNSQTLTLSGYDGYVIKGLTLTMHSNGSSGAGTLSVNVGSTSIAAISSATGFNSWGDNTSYGTDYRDVHITLSNDNQTVGTGQNIVIVISGTTNSLFCSTFKLCYEQAAVTQCATPTFSLAEGSYCGDQSVTLSCATDGATIHYTTDGIDPTDESAVYSSAIPVTSTTTIKAKAFKTNYTASSVASATYTITTLKTMDEIYAAATSSETSVCIKFNNWIISGVSTNGKNVYLTDGTKGLIIYNSGGSSGFAVGDILSGTVTCNLKMYNQSAELVGLTSSTSGLTVTTGGTVTPTVMNASEIAALTGVNTGRVITTTGEVETCNSTKQCINGAQLYDQLYSYAAVTTGNTYTCTGVYLRYGTTQEILPLSDLSTSCTAPSSVGITGTNKYLGGQTISLTAAPSGGSGSPTYQWQKEVNSEWTNVTNGTTDGVTISGATTNNLQITPCNHSHSGQYRCVVSTGATCSTNSDAYGVHVFSVYGGYVGESWSDEEINFSVGTSGSATVHLNAGALYKFHIRSNNGAYYCNGTADYNGDGSGDGGTTDGWYVLKSSSGISFWRSDKNYRIYTGPEGDYTITVDIANALTGGDYVTVGITYPTPTSHPCAGYAYFEKPSEWTNVYLYWYTNDNSRLTGWTGAPEITATASICGKTYYYTPLGSSFDNVIFKGNGSNQWTSLATSGFSGKYLDKTTYASPAWATFTSFTITFAGNGNTGGSMTDVTCISSGDDETLAANGFTKTDNNFTGWKTNVALTYVAHGDADDGTHEVSVAANGIVPDQAKIKNITGNITLTAQWQQIQDTFIDIVQSTTGYTELSPHTETGTYSTPSLSDKAVATTGTCQQQHYHFVGWITEAIYEAGTTIAAGDLQTPTTADGSTYYAVWAKQSTGGGGSSATSISSYTDGDYYIVDTRAEVTGHFFALNGGVSSNAIPVTDITDAVTDNTTSITLDLTNAVIDAAMIYRLTTVGDSITIQHVGTSTTISQTTNDTKFETTGTRNWTIAKHSTDNRFTIQSWFTKSGTKTSCILMQYSNWNSSEQVLTLTAKPFNSSNMGGTAAKAQNYMSGYMYLVPASVVSYTDYIAKCCQDWPATPTVSYSSSLAIGATEAVTVSGTTYGAVSYESSDENVLTVAADGTVTIVGAGTAHVIATWEGNSTYCEKSVNSNDISVSGIMITGTTPVNFGQVYQNAVVANKTISVTGINLASAITPSLPAGSPFSFSPASLAANSSDATLTISANTATTGTYNQTLTLTSGTYTATVTVKMEVIAMPSCTFVDGLHNLTEDKDGVTLSSYNLTAAQGTAVVFPILANQTKGSSTCEDQHYIFVGWTIGDNNSDPEDHLVTSHTLANGDAISYYAVWADGVSGTSYTKLTSSTFKTSPTKYVIGADYGGTDYFLYSCTKTDANNSWGVCSSDPSTDAPIQFTLSGTASALVATSAEATARYLNPASGKQFFGMSATSKTVVLGSGGTIESSADSYNLLGYNYNSGNGGLRWYNSTDNPAYFYEVVTGGSTVSYRTSCCANKVDAPDVTVTKTSVSITLTWGDETGATGWEVSWNGGAFGSPSGTRTHTVSGLTPNTTYTWKVRATYTTPKCGADIASGSTTTNQVYHVTYAKGDESANCTATGSTTDAVAHEAGATVTLQGNEFHLSGYTFNAWTTDDPDVTISNNQITMPDHDVVITATWNAVVDKYFDRMHDQTDALHGGVEETTSGPNEGKYYIAKEGCNYAVPTAVDSNTGDACQTNHYKLQGWIAASHMKGYPNNMDGTIKTGEEGNMFQPTGTKTATGATYYAIWAEVTE